MIIIKSHISNLILSFKFSLGFELMFGMTGSKAELLSIPATYATAFGFIFSYGRLMLAMSESRLLPRILRVKWGKAASATTSASTIVGSIIGYVVCIFVYFFPAVEKHLFNICILSAFGAYLSQFVGFINLRTRLADLPRLYHSPLGLFGAYYGIAVFSLAAISVIVFQKDGHMAFITVFIISVLTSAHYFCTAKHHQKFSKDELKTLFNAHVLKCKFLRLVRTSLFYSVHFFYFLPCFCHYLSFSLLHNYSSSCSSHLISYFICHIQYFFQISPFKLCPSNYFIANIC